MERDLAVNQTYPLNWYGGSNPPLGARNAELFRRR